MTVGLLFAQQSKKVGSVSKSELDIRITKDEEVRSTWVMSFALIYVSATEQHSLSASQSKLLSSETQKYLTLATSCHFDNSGYSGCGAEFWAEFPPGDSPKHMNNLAIPQKRYEEINVNRMSVVSFCSTAQAGFERKIMMLMTKGTSV